MYHQEAIDEAHQRTRCQCHNEGHPDGHTGIHNHNGQNTAQAECAAYRQVTATANNGNGNAEGNNLQDCRGAEHFQHTVSSVEFCIKEEHHHHHYDDGNNSLLLGDNL